MKTTIPILIGVLLLFQSLFAGSTIQFQTRVFTVAERAGQVALPVVRLNDLETAVAVEFYSVGATATAAQDFTAVSGTLSFAAGVTNQTINVPILNDAMVETLERFQVILTNAGGGAVLGSMKLATVSIEDNDTGPHFVSATHQVAEDAGTVQIQVNWAIDVDEPQTVDYATIDGTALAGTDYEAVSGTLVFEAGERIKQIDIPILNDALVESLERFQVVLTNATGGAVLGSMNVAMVSIEDNDTGPHFVSATHQVAEDAGTIQIQVNWAITDTDEPQTVDYTTIDGTALAGTDYEAVSGTLVFEAGERIKQIPVVILNDGVKDPDKSFQVQLSNASSEGLGDPSLATMIIQDPTPVIYTQPTPASQSVSLEAAVKIEVSGKGARMQWQKRVGAGEFADIPGATSQVLEWSSATEDLTGDYRVVVSNAIGEIVISQIATLVVDSTFTKITEGPVVTDLGGWECPSWWDYDIDGYLDLFVAQTWPTDTVGNAVYHNNQDGTFTRVSNAITAPRRRSWMGAVGDYDNDGNEDLLVHHFAGAEDLFRNHGGGLFTAQTMAVAGPPVGDLDDSTSVGWADYDRDGFIDLFAANSVYNSSIPGRDDSLYRNNGDGSFTRMTSDEVGMLVGDQVPTGPCAWVDYNNDLWPDLWLGASNAEWPNVTGRQYLWRNNGDGTFGRVSPGSLHLNLARGLGFWADYDNDGYLDLFLTAWNMKNSLHRNLNGESFGEVSAAAGVDRAMQAWTAAWGDYDNDGFLDLMVLCYEGADSVLYRNNGDGTFTSIDGGSPIREGVRRVGAAWADYDNDGFLDLLITCGDGGPTQNLLYRNNGNSNGWLKVKLVGTTSNRSAIGAKVRVIASIFGRPDVSQLREITGNSGEDGGSGGLVTHFGLGDARTVRTLKIEWPSGTVQELADVAVNQMLKITEPRRPIMSGAITTEGSFQIEVTTESGRTYELQASDDLGSWATTETYTGTGEVMRLTPIAPAEQYRFYRVVSP